MAAPKSIPDYPPEPPIDPQVVRASDELLAEAAAILDLPDEEISEEILEQARKKLWDAVTSRLKVFADARGWYFCEDSIASRLMGRIDEVMGADEPELITRFASAELVRYGDWCCADDLEPGTVRHRLPIIRTLCARLDDTHRTLPLNLTPPTDQYYRAAAQRCAERRARSAGVSA